MLHKHIKYQPLQEGENSTIEMIERKKRQHYEDIRKASEDAILQNIRVLT